MIRVAIVGVALLWFSSTACYGDGSSGGLRLVNQALDPGVEIESFAWINSLTSISGFREAPGLILRVPCFRQDLEKRAALHTTYPDLQIHTPDSLSWCRPQRIPRGADAGRYIDQHGHVFARQPALSGAAAPPPAHAMTEIGAGGVMQVFDPPVEVKDSEWMTSLTTFSSFPGAPGLILRVPCFRKDLGNPPSPNPVLVLRPPLQMPKFSSVWCAAKQIPRGEWAGRYVEVNGEVIVPPPR
ncbi:MAG TPA: hypothetical protein VN934_06960 [Candidatus Tumulicola sp.]|nr:hypothetical protein [Candidatus Tumulicola sp.]